MLLHLHAGQWGEVRKRWLWKRWRRRRRPDLLASVVVEEKTVAGGGVGRTEAGSRRCRRGYCWEGWAGAGAHRLKGEGGGDWGSDSTINSPFFDHWDNSAYADAENRSRCIDSFWNLKRCIDGEMQAGWLIWFALSNWFAFFGYWTHLCDLTSDTTVTCVCVCVPLGRLRYCPVSLGSSLMATGFPLSWPGSCRETQRQTEPLVNAALKLTSPQQRCQSSTGGMLTVRFHGDPLCGGAGLNMSGGPSRGWGSNLWPTSGSSCFTKMAERSWLKLHSNSGGRKKKKTHHQIIKKPRKVYFWMNERDLQGGLPRGSNWWLLNLTFKELPQNIWTLPDRTGYYRTLDDVAPATAVHNLSPVSEFSTLK